MSLSGTVTEWVPIQLRMTEIRVVLPLEPPPWLIGITSSEVAYPVAAWPKRICIHSRTSGVRAVRAWSQSLLVKPGMYWVFDILVSLYLGSCSRRVPVLRSTTPLATFSRSGWLSNSSSEHWTWFLTSEVRALVLVSVRKLLSFLITFLSWPVLTAL